MCPFSETNAAPMRTLRTLQAGQSDLNTQARHLLSVRLEFHSLATMTLRKRSSLMASDAANAKRKPPQRQSSDTRYRRKGALRQDACAPADPDSGFAVAHIFKGAFVSHKLFPSILLACVLSALPAFAQTGAAPKDVSKDAPKAATTAANNAD